MRIIGLAGWSGSGKTTLITKLIPRLIARGFSVSTLKHAHHGFDLDQPGKDSFIHRAAGATEVIITSAKRWAILHELREQPEWDLADLLGKLSPVDLVLVEGFKRDAFPKLEIHRVANGKPLIQPDDPHIVAIASRHAAAAGQGAGDRSRRHRGDRRCAAQARRAVSRRGCQERRDGATHRRLLCVLRPAAAARRHGAADRRARAPVAETESVPLARGARPRARRAT